MFNMRVQEFQTQQMLIEIPDVGHGAALEIVRGLTRWKQRKGYLYDIRVLETTVLIRS